MTTYYKDRGTRLIHIWILIGVNSFACVGTIIAGVMGHDLILLLGLRAASFLEQPWTIVTNLFVHGGIWDLAVEMLLLYFFGSLLSKLISINKFVIVYFVGGIVGNVFFMFFASPYPILIGALGAVIALMGAIIVLAPKSRHIIPIPIWIVITILVVLFILLPGAAWQSNVGGLISGLVAGGVLRKRANTFQ